MKFLVTLTIFLVFSFAFVKCDEDSNSSSQESHEDGVTEEPLPEPKGDECAGVEDEAYLPYDGKCDLFIHCDRDVPHVKSCGKFLHFNKETQVCDYPENARCQ